MHECLFRTGLPPSIPSSNALRNNRELPTVNTVHEKLKIPLTRITIQLRTNTISLMGYDQPVALQYPSSSSSFVIGTFSTFLNPLITPPAADDVTSEPMTFGSKTHGWVRFAKSASCDRVSKHIESGKVPRRTGLPRVHNSQSRMPITRFSVGWKIILSNL